MEDKWELLPFVRYCKNNYIVYINITINWESGIYAEDLGNLNSAVKVIKFKFMLGTPHSLTNHP